MPNMKELLGLPSGNVDTAFAMALVFGLDDTSVDDGQGTQDGGGVSGDPGTEPRSN